MIANMSKASEKRYKITDTKGKGLPESALAGQYVSASELWDYTVTGASGTEIPTYPVSKLHSSNISLYAGVMESFFFVMPAEDVTIS